jgi:hypothetical protein
LILLFATPGFTAEQKAVTLNGPCPLPFERLEKISSGLERKSPGGPTEGKFDFFWSGTLLKYQDIVVGIGKVSLMSVREQAFLPEI